MKVEKLSTVPFETLIDCFLKSFENYYVPLSTDPEYYRNRWNAANVRYDLSYGMFDEGKLVGFIINAIDSRNGHTTAFNTGTGVIPDYRGKQIVKTIYDYALPDLKNNGVTKCSLEVIQENTKAKHVYETIGFKINKEYRCFKGHVTPSSEIPVELEEHNLSEIEWELLPNQSFYSWDNHQNTIKKGNYKYYSVETNDGPKGYFIINPTNGYIAQINAMNTTEDAWNGLFNGVKQVAETITINNVDSRLQEKIKQIQAAGLTHTVDQFEMELFF
ncbi:GNAT family N-acetyltransferase [Flavobacterium sp. '19STA2R22 D10 B1']|uniref:GNAT family N-acetyltransferase n=1 Tax=Flavobacterium aerium TaxID=3037261 RepID=UPI00278C6A46|nr:GNAT family N-acetyltransferase [Flavobacterium sp. '19STA2R22 D10 B1']